MSNTQKLTKKQRKAVAFRDRKAAKSRSHHGDPAGLEGNAVPVLEEQNLVDNEVDPPAVAVAAESDEPVDRSSSASRKGKEKTKDTGTAAPTQTKRKRDHAAVDGETNEPAGERSRKKAKKGSVSTGAGEVEESTNVTKEKQRFILFVGNLKYTTTAEAIKAHFAACDPPPTVRLRTPKPSTSGKPVTKSKGCAFVEFTHRNALQQGLKLHQSELEGRRINVELTAGGGGKGEARLSKLRERNKGLFNQRLQKDHKEKLAKTDPSLSSVLDLPQRFSATSGLEQVQSKRRTWAVADDEEDGPTHRGGKKHAKSRSRGKQWGTGVNAIPVG
ncbi:hypothetical protein GGX14DRAFT_528087 [Mycena pura]|uniref:RRM domain-containing protein n=1 Tax=Mycena pura TaxID=153505 RepID=A0AAD6US25_9AGAR|nr:hypothetical protein GGX14DRAFT_528087 [Mycena pura]